MRPDLAALHELVDIVPGGLLKLTTRAQFQKSLGIQEIDSGGDARDKLLQHLSGIAYETPLPPHWAEEVDVAGYVYFFHLLTSESRWSHPLLECFTETFAFVRKMVDEELSLEAMACRVEANLKEIQQRACEALEPWSGPHRHNGEDFFFRQDTGESSWVNPLEQWQYDLHTRYWLLVQCLQECDFRQQRETTREPKAPVAVVAPPALVTPRFAESLEVDEDSQSVLMGSLAASELSASVMSMAASIASSLASGAFSFRGEGSFNNGPPLPAIPSSGRSGAVGDQEPEAPALPPPPGPPPTRQLPQPPRLQGKMPPALFKTLLKPRRPPTAPPLPDDPLSVVRVAPRPRTLKAKPVRIDVSPNEREDGVQDNEELELPSFLELELPPPPPPPPKRSQNPDELGPPDTPPLTGRSLTTVESLVEECIPSTIPSALAATQPPEDSPLEDSMVVFDGNSKKQRKWSKGVCIIS